MSSVLDRIARLSPEQREALLSRLAHQRTTAAIHLEPRAWSMERPLSFSQERLWFVDRLDPGNPFYNIPAALTIRGRCDEPAVRRALTEIVRRHEVLRTRFVEVDGRPVAHLQPPFDPHLDVVDLRALSDEERADAVRRFGLDEARQPFDLCRGPLLRATLVHLTDQASELRLTLHHIVADGWSLNILEREFSALYAAFSRGETSPLPELPAQFPDFAVWQRERLAGERLEREIEFWREQLAPPLDTLRLPTDRPRPAQSSFAGAAHCTEVSPATTARLRALGASEGATLFMTLLAAFDAVLTRTTGQTDVVVGTPVAGRDLVDVEPLVGFFANTLVLRTDTSGNPSFRALLGRVRETTHWALAHAELPFEKLVEDLAPEREADRTPLFQVAFALQSTLRTSGEGSLELLEFDGGAVRFDLECHAWEDGDRVRVAVVYRTDLFNADTIAALADRYVSALDVVAADPDLRLSELCASGRTVPGESERREVHAALLKIDGVEDCHIAVRRDARGPDELIAYIVPRAGVSEARVERALARVVPGRILPAAIVAVSRIPLDDSGSVDERRLAEVPVLDADVLRAARRVLMEQAGSADARVSLGDISRPVTRRVHVGDLLARAELASRSMPGPVTIAGSAETRSSAPALSRGADLVLPEDHPATLGDVLDRAATRAPARGIVFPSNDGSVLQLSYRSLLEDSTNVLGALQARGLQPRDPVILQLEREADFVTAFWACMLGGLVAVPLAAVAAFDTDGASARKLASVRDRLDGPPILCSGATRDHIARALGAPGDRARLLTVEQLRDESVTGGARAGVSPEDLAVLLFTSGSTGRPKAVALSHANVTARSAASIQFNHFTVDDVSLNWMPLDHVGGLVMFHIRDVYATCNQVLAPTQAILRDPLLWLDWIDRFRATITWAPNFAFGLVNDRLAEGHDRKWDLSSMRHILNGGEAVVARTARRFLAGLASYALSGNTMRPAWGMSETSSGVTDSHAFSLTTTHDDDTFVEVGSPIPGTAVRIVDESDRMLSEGEVGRLQVKGPTVTRGYHCDPDLNEASFTADGWFKTGDLGVLRVGRLSITGRDKDVVIVNGVNYASHEIEAVVQDCPGVMPAYAAACAVRSATRDTDDLAVFFVPRAAPGGEQLADLVRRVRGEVTRRIGITPSYLLPVDEADVPRTGIGKIQRSLLKARFESGDFDAQLRAVDLAESNDRTLPGWFYRVVWRPRHGLQPANGRAAQTVLVGDTTGLARQVAARLGEGCRLVSPTAEGWAAAWASLQPGQPLVYLLDDVAEDAPTHALGAIQGLVKAGQNQPGLALFVVTRGAHIVAEGDRGNPMHASIGALVETVAQEHPDFVWRHIDLEGLDTESDADALVAEFTTLGPERQVAWRAGGRLVARLAAAGTSEAGTPEVTIQRGGLYLITGGLGGVGVHLAAHLRTAFAARLLLVGRSRTPGGHDWRAGLVAVAPSLGTADALAGIEYVAADVADVGGMEAVRSALGAVEVRWGVKLGGIFHLAGDFHARALVDETPGGLAEVARAKVAGARALATLAAERVGVPLIAFSSANGFFGGAGVGAYAAANAALDTLVLSLRRNGLPAQALAWSMWDETGMSRGYTEKEFSRARGFELLTPEMGLRSTLAALGMAEPRLLIGLDPRATAVRRLISDEPPCGRRLDAFVVGDAVAQLVVEDRFGVAARCAPLAVSTLPATDRSVDRTVGLQSEGPVDETEQAMLAVWREVLGSAWIAAEDNFFQLGGHSLLATRLLARVRRTFDVDLPLAVLFEAPTPRGLSLAVKHALAADHPQPIPAPAHDVTTLAPTPADRFAAFPLTDVQEAYWIGRQAHYALGSVGAHEYMEVDCPGLDVARFGAAWRALIDRHDMLRAVVTSDGKQRVLASLEWPSLPTDDLRDLPPNEVEARLAAVRARMSHQVLPVETGPAWEVRASRLADDRVRLHISIDALVLDAWSWSILTRELGALYDAPETPLQELDITFRDYVVAQAASTRTAEFEQALAYWRGRLESLPPAPALPMRRAEPDDGQQSFARRAGVLDRPDWERFKTFARRAGLTPSAALLAAFAETLAIWSASARFTLNLTLFHRPPVHPRINDVVGDFTSLIPLEVSLEAPADFRARGRQVQAQLWADLEYRQVSGVRVLRELAQLRKDPAAASLPVVFSSALGLDAADGETFSLGRFGETTFAITQTPQVWLDHGVWEERGCLLFNWDFVETLFLPGLMDDAFAAYCRLLDRLAADEGAWTTPARELGGDVGPAGSEPLGLRFDAPPTDTLIGLFEGQAARTPEAVAVITATREITYGELSRASAALAARLLHAGVGRGDLVAVAMDKGWEQVAAVLGVLRAGAAYLPVDPGLPADRQRVLLESGRVGVALTQPRAAARVVTLPSLNVLAIDETWLHGDVVDPLPPLPEPEDLAYVIFTSGSTGQPKGVMIDHRGAVNTILDINDRFGVTSADRVLALSALSFDLSVYDIFGLLAAGGAVVVPDPLSALDPAHWARMLTQRGVTIWNSVPALMHLLVDYAAGRKDHPALTLRLVLLSGDWIPVSLPDAIRRIAPEASVISLGGATEASIWSIMYPIEEVDPTWKSIPYGHGMRNQPMFVLDRELRRCPACVPGELYIGGIGVALGYLGAPQLTAERFIIHPVTGERLYRTGDWGRYWPDGTIEFLGRQDGQVKIRGYRIELGEIELALTQQPDVAAAVALATTGQDGEQRLFGYVVPRGGARLDVSALRSRLAERLPSYMVPAAVAAIDRVPLTSNGKVDRSALPAPDDARVSENIEKRSRAGVADSVAEIVRDILEVEAVSAEDDLFALGATSMAIVRIVNRLERDLGVRPTIESIYLEPTVGALAAACGAGSGRGQSYEGQRPPALSDSIRPMFPTILDPSEQAAFKATQPALRPAAPGAPVVSLFDARSEDVRRAAVAARRSHRQFASSPVPATALGQLLAELRRVQTADGLRAQYASAGGLYPVQTYVYVKPGRVDGLIGGGYYYDPESHQLVLLTSDSGLDASAYDRLVNRQIYDQAAFSIFLVADLSAIAPIYGEWSVHLATLEAGLMAQLLDMAAAPNGLGTCQIGSIEVAPLGNLFRLSERHVLVHSLLGGAALSAASDEREEGEL